MFTPYARLQTCTRKLFFFWEEMHRQGDDTRESQTNTGFVPAEKENRYRWEEHNAKRTGWEAYPNRANNYHQRKHLLKEHANNWRKGKKKDKKTQKEGEKSHAITRRKFTERERERGKTQEKMWRKNKSDLISTEPKNGENEKIRKAGKR